MLKGRWLLAAILSCRLLFVCVAFLVVASGRPVNNPSAGVGTGIIGGAGDTGRPDRALAATAVSAPSSEAVASALAAGSALPARYHGERCQRLLRPSSFRSLEQTIKGPYGIPWFAQEVISIPGALLAPQLLVPGLSNTTAVYVRNQKVHWGDGASE